MIAKGFVEGEIKEIKLGPNGSISLLTNKKIIAYKN